MVQKVDDFHAQYPKGYQGTFAEGMEVVSKWLPPRVNAVKRALAELEGYFGPITWETMEFDMVKTYLRYQNTPSQAGANQIINGVAMNGTTVQYRYYQPDSAESGNRLFKYGQMAWKPISQIHYHFDRIAA